VYKTGVNDEFDIILFNFWNEGMNPKRMAQGDALFPQDPLSKKSKRGKLTDDTLCIFCSAETLLVPVT
jgi:ADP-ribosylglycohydrolase